VRSLCRQTGKIFRQGKEQAHRDIGQPRATGSQQQSTIVNGLWKAGSGHALGKAFVAERLFDHYRVRSIWTSASKLNSFGLNGWAARTPFYLLPLQLTPALVFTPRLTSSYLKSARLLAQLFTLPLGLWVIAARCPGIEAVAHLAVGTVKGLLLACRPKVRKGR
jgi:hypothetical protein